jgi:hypothetical protein
MDWKDYFSNTNGKGFLATSNARGEIDIAPYSKPRVLPDGTFVFGMADRLTHTNLQENPRAVYAFAEERGWNGRRFYLYRTKEETSGSPMLEEIRKITDQCVHPGAGKLIKFVVHFRVDSQLPLICEKCSGEHSQHLCELAGGERFDLIKELAKKPDYMCMNCGRMADNRASLCNPMPMEDIPASH